MNRAPRIIVLLPLAVIVGTTAVAYLPALRGGFIWDDDDHITRNLAVVSADGLRKIWFEPRLTPQYYPLVFSSFWLEYRLWGANPLGFHVSNVVLHILNAWILWLVLRRLSIPAAWLAAGIFALHPVHVESVAWITERKNVLSGCFYLTSILAYLRFAAIGDTRTVKEDCRREWFSYFLAFMLFTAALLAKTVSCSLPAVMLLLLWWKDRLTVKTAMPLLPFFVVGMLGAATTIWFERTQIGAVGVDWDLSPVQRCLIAGRALWFYLGKLAWPTRLSFIYPRWTINAGQWWQYLYPISFVVLLVVLWVFRRAISKGPLVACLIYSGTLLPALGFFDVYPMRFSFVADHFQYLASIAPMTLFVAWLAGLHAFRGEASVREAAGRPAWPPVKDMPTLLGVPLLGILAILTWGQAHIYKDHQTVWRDTIAKNPMAWIAHLNLGGLLQQQGRVEEAIEHWAIASQLGGDAYKAHNNLGLAFVELGRPDEAKRHFRQAIRCNRRVLDPYNNLAWLLATYPDDQVRDGAEAVRLAERAARMCRRGNPFVLGTLGAAYAELGRFADAIAVTQEAMSLVSTAYPATLLENLQNQLRRYQSDRPYRQREQGFQTSRP